MKRDFAWPRINPDVAGYLEGYETWGRTEPCRTKPGGLLRFLGIPSGPGRSPFVGCVVELPVPTPLAPYQPIPTQPAEAMHLDKYHGQERVGAGVVASQAGPQPPAQQVPGELCPPATFQGLPVAGDARVSLPKLGWPGLNLTPDQPPSL
ncbi:hypothetical protein DSO57_1032898 [Entomophthora muscae]|uniref:Uncharacterized protein n=1 Tax=Entomophthora muscae TaxID=34485 RepID=A0ACC2RR83_9FUNG|nr:hypothetical protein DSO57_1032898 [Entomophthora muscae]